MDGEILGEEVTAARVRTQMPTLVDGAARGVETASRMPMHMLHQALVVGLAERSTKMIKHATVVCVHLL